MTVELHGHRGCRGLSPENTIEGFTHSLSIGVDALELDVRLTADGVVVVTHDPALNPDITRDANGEWLAAPGGLIRALPYAALRAFDVGRICPGTAYAEAFPEQLPCDGARIPTLGEVLRLGPEVKLTIEIKSSPRLTGWTATQLAEAVLLDLDRAAATGRVVVQSFDWRVLRYLREARTDLSLAWLTSRATAASARVRSSGVAGFGGALPRAVAAEGGRTWAAEHDQLSAARVAEAHKLGLRVLAWTVNLPARMRQLLDWGVDGLITDRPDLARPVLAENGLALPPRRVIPADLTTRR